jgi:uncharacterized protein (DUF427 family)
MMSGGREIKPGPDHPITVLPNPGQVIVRLGDSMIADSRHALTLREASYPPVQYIPRADVDMTLLEKTAHGSHCPYKGDASYFSLRVGGKLLANAVWSYETPYESVAPIAGHLAFYANKVQISEQD